MSNQNKLKKQIQERARADAERLKALTHEDEVRDGLRAYFGEFLGVEGAYEVLDRFWKVRCHHLWDDHYRINFWTKISQGYVPTVTISYSFFVKYSPLKGFYYSNPDMKAAFDKKES